MVIPKYFVSFTIFSDLLFNLSLTELYFLNLPLNIIPTVFFSEIFTLDFFLHQLFKISSAFSDLFDKSLLEFPVSTSKSSSAKHTMNIFFSLIVWINSLMLISHTSGPRIDPCGQPSIISFSHTLFPIINVIYLLCRLFLKIFKILLGHFLSLNILIKYGHQTLSKAPSISTNIPIAYLTLEFFTYLDALFIASSVDLPALKPNCDFDIFGILCKWNSVVNNFFI